MRRAIMVYLVAASVFFGIAAQAERSSLEAYSKERVIFHTNVGDIAVALFPNAAPKHVRQILKLALAGVLDSVPIYRVEPGFVAQISNYNHRTQPLNKAQSELVFKIPAEFTSIHHRRGILSMARFDDPDSAETSFSFMLGDAKHLDGKYTVFGEIVAGIEVLDVIEKVPTDSSSNPLVELTLLKTTVVPHGDLSDYKLMPPMAPNDPDAPYQRFFKIFAGLAFAFTILLPIVKTFWSSYATSRRVA